MIRTLQITALAGLMLIAGWFVTPVIAQEAEEPTAQFDVLLGGGAMICDTEADVIAALNGLPTRTCGILQTRNGMPATVTIIGEYQDKPLARFDFHNPTPWGNQTQFGWWAGEIPDSVTPTAAGVEA